MEHRCKEHFGRTQCMPSSRCHTSHQENSVELRQNVKCYSSNLSHLCSDCKWILQMFSWPGWMGSPRVLRLLDEAVSSQLPEHWTKPDACDLHFEQTSGRLDHSIACYQLTCCTQWEADCLQHTLNNKQRIEAMAKVCVATHIATYVSECSPSNCLPCPSESPSSCLLPSLLLCLKRRHQLNWQLPILNGGLACVWQELADAPMDEAGVHRDLLKLHASQT